MVISLPAHRPSQRCVATVVMPKHSAQARQHERSPRNHSSRTRPPLRWKSPDEHHFERVAPSSSRRDSGRVRQNARFTPVDSSPCASNPCRSALVFAKCVTEKRADGHTAAQRRRSRRRPGGLPGRTADVAYVGRNGNRARRRSRRPSSLRSPISCQSASISRSRLRNGARGSCRSSGDPRPARRENYLVGLHRCVSKFARRVHRARDDQQRSRARLSFPRLCAIASTFEKSRA